MLARAFVLGCLVLMLPVQSGAQLPNLQDSAGNRLNVWTARTSNGRALMGTWTAVADTLGETVRGTWTLINARGSTLAVGTWSAAKSATEWNGSWRATVAQHSGDYGGTWSARMDSEPRAPLAAMFQRAMTAVVGGSWWFGNHGGTWSVRAYEDR